MAPAAALPNLAIAVQDNRRANVATKNTDNLK